MADAQRAGWTLRRLETAVELARKVGRPLTFFAAMGFILLLTIPITLWANPDSLVPPILSVAVIIDIICVLIWAKAKLKQDPKAFQDE